MANDNPKNMKVREEDLIDARCINFEERLYDWQILNSLLNFCKDCPKEFEKWKKKEETNKETTGEIETKAVNIIREKKQLSVRFPADIEERFDITPEKDGFIWVIRKEKVENQETISLSGILTKGKNLKKENENKG